MPFADTFTVADPKKHNLKGFRCGKTVMDSFLGRYAARNMRLGISRTWVLPVDDGQAKAEVAAYFTLASSTVRREDIPSKENLPGYPVPVVLLARLAVPERFQGQGLGEKTLISSLRLAVELSRNGLPAIGLVLDVLDDEALGFYQSYEMFEPFSDDPRRLFVPMRVLEQI